MKKKKYSKKLQWIIGMGLLVSSCSSQDALTDFCDNATPDSYKRDFHIWCPIQGGEYFLPTKYGCLPNGEGISPPISWRGVPEGATHLRITVEDVTCTSGCSPGCKYIHWILDLPLKDLKETTMISQGAIAEGAIEDPSVKALSLPNSPGKREYQPFCPAAGQTHAIVFRAIAYRFEGTKPIILGRSQSVPMLYSIDHK